MVKLNILSFLVLIILVVIMGCNGSMNKNSIIQINIKAPSEGIIYLVKTGLKDGIDQIVDSSGNGIFNSYSFKVIKDSSSIYQVKIPLFNDIINIIPDNEEIVIQANLANKKYTVTGSIASNTLYNLQKTINELNSRQMHGKVDIVNGLNGVSTSFTLPYIDTVSNPAVFMVAYNTIEFNNNFKLLKQVVDKATNRFPAVPYISQLKIDVYRMIDVYEKEFNVGDVLPVITLEEKDAHSFSTSTLGGKYYLINFWSTWCNQCFPFMESLKKQAEKIDGTKLNFVSTAIDDNKEDWKKIILQNNYSWINLIDEKMWKGEAVNTLKFDSIPFNFLISPEGKVLAKAIPPDSLQYYLQKYNLIKR